MGADCCSSQDADKKNLLRNCKTPKKIFSPDETMNIAGELSTVRHRPVDDSRLFEKILEKTKKMRI